MNPRANRKRARDLFAPALNVEQRLPGRPA
jgi:hypothetical protein